jgi:hypothetical protein
MNGDIRLPKNYKPARKLTLCGNTLIDVNIPFEVDGGIPLLIGTNGEPQIWLNARPSSHGKPWPPIIRQNRSMHKAAEIRGVGTDNIIINVQGTKVLTLEKHEPDTLKITELDLRPIGLNIYGDRSKLVVGTNQLVSNTFENLNVMIGIGRNNK